MLRANRTANGLVASNVKNQTPGLPLHDTYVRTFNSGNFDIQGMPGSHLGATPLIVNGTTLIHAVESNSSTSRPAGICGTMQRTGTGQCIKSRLCQFILMAGLRFGKGQARSLVEMNSPDVTNDDIRSRRLGKNELTVGSFE